MTGPLPRRWPRAARLTIAGAASLIATSVAFYLWSLGSAGSAGCDALGVGDCDAALSSRWATLAGLPVSLLGGLCYATLLVGVGLVWLRVAAAWWLIELVVPAAFGAAAWFVGLQASGASAVCPYCLTIHTAGVIACGLLIAERAAANRRGVVASVALAPVALTTSARSDPAGHPAADASPPPLGLLTLLGVLGAIGLVVGQLAMPPEIKPIDASELNLAFDTSTAPALAAAPMTPATPIPPATPTTHDTPVAESTSGAAAQTPEASPGLASTVADSEPGGQPPTAPSSSTPSPADRETTGAEPGPGGPEAEQAARPLAAPPASAPRPEPKTEQPETERNQAAPAGRVDERQPPATDPALTSPASAKPAPGRPRVRRGRRAGAERIVTLLDGKLTIDTHDYPVLGSPDAPHVAVELMDYACAHCREFAVMLEEARPRYGDQLVVVVLPVATELLCNKYVKRVRPASRGGCRLTRVSLALAEASPEAFPEFHHWLLEADRLRSWDAALVQARRLSGSERVDEVFVSPGNKRRLQSNIELFGVLARAGARVLPSQILGDTVAPGKPASVEQLCALWEEQLGVRPVRAP